MTKYAYSYSPDDRSETDDNDDSVTPGGSCPFEFDPSVSRVTQKDKNALLRRFDRYKSTRLSIIICRILISFASFLTVTLFLSVLYDDIAMYDVDTLIVRIIIFFVLWICLTIAGCWILSRAMKLRFKDLVFKRQVIFIKKVHDSEKGFSDFFHLYVWEYVSDHPEQVVYYTNFSKLLSKKLKEGDLLYRYSGTLENGNTLNIFESQKR